MKKILFIAFAFAAISNTASAQAKVSPTMTPPPSKEQLEKDNNAKAQSVDALSVPKQETAPKNSNTANYKKAGLTEAQIAEVSKTNTEFDQRKATIQSNTSLTPEQRKSALEAIETERNATMRKSMGEDGYKRYSLVSKTQQGKLKPVKEEKKTN